MKFRVFYSGDRTAEDTIEAENHRLAAQQFFSAHPVLEDRQITVETTGWRNLKIEEFQAGEFLDDATRASLLAIASTPPPPSQPPAPGLAIVFRVLGTLELIGGFVWCCLLWPGSAGEGYSWRAIAYMPSIAWLLAGIIFGCLFLAVAEVLVYLRDIRDSFTGRPNQSVELTATRGTPIFSDD